MTAQVSSHAAQTIETAAYEVLVEVRNHIGHLTLNRPAGLNALTLGMVRSLQQQLDTWALDPQIRAVVLRGAGDKAFCAGGDIRSLYDSHKQGDTLHEDFFVEEYALDLTIHHYRKPILALMDGFVLGGGMGLVQGADLRVVTERSRLAMPEVAIGYFPDVGGSYFLPRIPGELGIYLGVSGVQIRAADALYCGLADWYLDSRKLKQLDERLDRLEWHDAPLKDLQSLLAKLGQQQLPAPPGRLAAGHRPFFCPARRAEHGGAVAPGHRRQQPRMGDKDRRPAGQPLSPGHGRDPGNATARATFEPGKLFCPGAASGPAMVRTR